METRHIILINGTGMGDNAIIFQTNAPKERLEKLEEFCKGKDYDNVPIWADVLSQEGYVFEYVEDYTHVTAYGTSDDNIVKWEQKNVPIAERYIIEYD